MKTCPSCGGPVEMADMTGVTFRWPDDTLFDPQPQDGTCTQCGANWLFGLTPENRLRLEAYRQWVPRRKSEDA